MFNVLNSFRNKKYTPFWNRRNQLQKYYVVPKYDSISIKHEIQIPVKKQCKKCNNIMVLRCSVCAVTWDEHRSVQMHT